MNEERHSLGALLPSASRRTLFRYPTVIESCGRQECATVRFFARSTNVQHNSQNNHVARMAIPDFRRCFDGALLGEGRPKSQYLSQTFRGLRLRYFSLFHSDLWRLSLLVVTNTQSLACTSSVSHGIFLRPAGGTLRRLLATGILHCFSGAQWISLCHLPTRFRSTAESLIIRFCELQS